MIGRRSLLVAAVVALLLGGGSVGVAGAANGPSCQGSGVVGVAHGETIAGNVSLYAGSTLELGVCENGSVTGFNATRLASHAGFAVVTNTGRPTVRITGEQYPIDFTALLASANGTGLTVTRPTATYNSSTIGGPVFFESRERARQFNRTERQFQDAVAAFTNATAALNETASDVPSSTSIAAGTVERANRKLERLNATQTWMAENATRLASIAKSQFGGTAALLQSRLSERRQTVIAKGESAIEAYRHALAARRAVVRSTILTYFGGAALGGLLVGVLAGAAVPLKQARNVEDQLRLSRNVTYGSRVALLPMAVGLLLTIAGLATLWHIDAGVLLEVFL